MPGIMDIQRGKKSQLDELMADTATIGKRSPIDAKSGGGKTGGAVVGKALSGGVIGNDYTEARDYLGHFGNDNVLKKGHNTGHKPLGKAPLVKTAAKSGYHKLPGSASPQQGRARYGTMSDSELGLKPPRHQREADAKAKARMSKMFGPVDMAVPVGPEPNKPRAVTDKRLSIKHHMDSIAFNKRHAVDHEREAKKHERELRDVRRTMPKGKKKA